MKRGGPDHPKVRRLRRRLQVGLAEVVGTLELLYHWVAKYAPAGDVGKFENADIEEACAWQGEPDALVQALQDERFLDAHPDYRLVLHGWSKHADDAVHAQLARAGTLFANGAMPKTSRLASHERPKCESLLEAARRNRDAGLKVTRDTCRADVGDVGDHQRTHVEPTTDDRHTHDVRTEDVRRNGSPASPPPAPPEKESAVFAAATTADGFGPNASSVRDVEAAAAKMFVELYLEICPQLPRWREITAKRRQKIAARLREHDLDWWRQVFLKLNASSFLRGEGTKGWRADLDWLIRDSTNALRVLEGSFDRGNPSRGVQHQRFADRSDLFQKEPAATGGAS